MGEKSLAQWRRCSDEASLRRCQLITDVLSRQQTFFPYKDVVRMKGVNSPNTRRFYQLSVTIELRSKLHYKKIKFSQKFHQFAFQLSSKKFSEIIHNENESSSSCFCYCELCAVDWRTVNVNIVIVGGWPEDVFVAEPAENESNVDEETRNDERSDAVDDESAGTWHDGPEPSNDDDNEAATANDGEHDGLNDNDANVNVNGRAQDDGTRYDAQS